MSETYTVLSPWAKSNYLKKNPITLRLSSLSGKTIGLYASFKEYHPFFMRELERQLAARLPDTKFSHYTYIVDAKEIRDDSANYEDFKTWLSTVDAVIGVGADMGSCALYMGYNFAEIERLGTPAVLLSKYQYLSSASKGAGAKSYPGLRIVTYDGPGFVPNGVDCNQWTIDTYRDTIAGMLDDIVSALTTPLTEEEQNPTPAKDWSTETFSGTLSEVNAWMYTHGWTNGTPVLPPTEEAVNEMLRGTELARDYAENEEESPWGSLPTDYGYPEGTNAVTLFWPSEHHQVNTANINAVLGGLCGLWHGGFDVGAMVTLPPETAKMFADAGYTKQAILEYMKEYNRRPSSEIPRAAIGNNHPRQGLVFPASGLVHSAPLFWNTEHIFVVVGGRDWGMCYLGGGDHGGPICKAARLPANYDQLAEEYRQELGHVDY